MAKLRCEIVIILKAMNKMIMNKPLPSSDRHKTCPG